MRFRIIPSSGVGGALSGRDRWGRALPRRAPGYRPRGPAYDEAAFCDAVLSDRVGLQFSARVGPPDDPEEARLDFVVKMLQTGKWRRYNPDIQDLMGFVLQYTSLFLTDRYCRAARDAERRERRHRGHACLRARSPGFDPARHAAAKELVERLVVRVDRQAASVMDAVVASGGNMLMAAGRVGLTLAEAMAALRRVRTTARETGVAPVID